MIKFAGDKGGGLRPSARAHQPNRNFLLLPYPGDNRLDVRLMLGRLSEAVEKGIRLAVGGGIHHDGQQVMLDEKLAAADKEIVLAPGKAPVRFNPQPPVPAGKKKHRCFRGGRGNNEKSLVHSGPGWKINDAGGNSGMSRDCKESN